MRIGLSLALAAGAIDPPVLSSLSVAVGTSAGGTAVTLTGSGFNSGDTVTFGGAAATSVVAVDSATITCVTPAGTLGAQDVVVTDAAARTSTLVGGFVYDQDPALLDCDGLWLDSYATNTNWDSTASAGLSGGTNRKLTILNLRPDASAPVNGFTGATFGGTQSLVDTVDTAEKFITTTAYSLSMLIKPTTAPADTTVYNNPGLFTEAGGNWGIVYSDAGVRVYHASATKVTLAYASVPTAAWTQVDVSFSAGVLRIRANGGAWTSAAGVAATGSVTGAAFRMACNFSTTRWVGTIMRAMVTRAVWTDAQFNGLYAYNKARFPAMGLP